MQDQQHQVVKNPAKKEGGYPRQHAQQQQQQQQQQQEVMHSPTLTSAATVTPVQRYLRSGETTMSQRGRPISQRGRSRGSMISSRHCRGSSSSSGTNSRQHHHPATKIHCSSNTTDNTTATPGSKGNSGMMRFMEGMVSPFVQCWQPTNLNSSLSSSSYYYNNKYAATTTTTTTTSCGGTGCATDEFVCGSSTATNSATTSTSSRPTISVVQQTNSTTMMVTPTTRSSVVVPPIQYRMYPRTTPKPPVVAVAVVPPPPPPPSTTMTPLQPLLPHHQQQRDGQPFDATTTTTNPCAMDVLCGRGGSSNRHNKHFRELVAANKAVYKTLTKKQKMVLSRKIVTLVHEAGGRFLAKDPDQHHHQVWVDIGLSRSLEKASQALREKGTNTTITTTTTTDSCSEVSMDTTIDENTNKKGRRSSIDNNSNDNKSTFKVNPRVVDAPPLIIPDHLKDMYQPFSKKQRRLETTTSAVLITDTNNNTKNHRPVQTTTTTAFPEHAKRNPRDVSAASVPDPWIADFFPVPAATVASRNCWQQQEQQQPCNRNNDLSDRNFTISAPHRRDHPFGNQQLSTKNQSQRQQKNDRFSQPTITASSNSYYQQQQQQHPYASSSWSEHVPSTPRPYRYCDREHRHPASPLEKSERATSTVAPTTTTTSPSIVSSTHVLDPTKRGGLSPEWKRQRTHEEVGNNNSTRQSNSTTNNAQLNDSTETRDEEEYDHDNVVLMHTSVHAFSLQNTSLTDGGGGGSDLQLPAEVESKLSLQDKVISPSRMLQVGNNTITKHRLNTSAEEEGLAGLVALSSAKFLQLDDN